MFKIKLLILLLINISLVSCTNNTGNNNFKLSVAYIGGEYDGLVLSNQLKSHLNNLGMFERSSKYEIQANISHSQNLYITNIDNTSDREKIDKLLEIDAHLYTNLGIDSTKKERLEVKRLSKKIYRMIQGINPAIGKTLLQAMDR